MLLLLYPSKKYLRFPCLSRYPPPSFSYSSFFQSKIWLVGIGCGNIAENGQSGLHHLSKELLGGGCSRVGLYRVRRGLILCGTDGYGRYRLEVTVL